MYKLKEFFGNLSKSTKLTVFSCGIFILLTFVILLFFVMFPITPSEKVISGMGRAGLVNSDGKKSNYGDSALDGVVITTTSSEKKNNTVTTAVGSHKSSYVDKIFTTNDGYVYTGNKTPIDYSESNQTYTRTVDNNNYNYQEPVYTDPPQSYEPEPDNNNDFSEPYEPSVPDYSEPVTPDIPDESSSEPEPVIPDVTEPVIPDDNPPDDSSYAEPVPSDEPDIPSDSAEF